MGDGLTTDGIFLIVEADDNFCGMEEMIRGGVPGEEKVPDKEKKVHEVP